MTTVMVRSATPEPLTTPPFRMGDRVYRKSTGTHHTVATVHCEPDGSATVRVVGDVANPVDSREFVRLCDSKIKRHIVIPLTQWKVKTGELVALIDDVKLAIAQCCESHLIEFDELHGQIDQLREQLSRARQKGHARRKELRNLNKALKSTQSELSRRILRDRVAVKAAEYPQMNVASNSLTD